VKPLVKGYGLDYLHLTLIVLVVVLVVLAFALTFSKPPVAVGCANTLNAQNCTTSAPVHNATQVLQIAEHEIAAYRNLNTSLSLLPYYSMVNRSTVSYVPTKKYWLVVVPYLDPYNSSVVFNFSMLVYDSNLSVGYTFINSVRVEPTASESAAGLGILSDDSISACDTKPLPVYLITDPYAPGALPAIEAAINASREYGSSINMSYFYIFSGYAISKYSGYTAPVTQQLGSYLACASRQRNFAQFISNLSSAYSGNPLSNYTLYQIALGSSLNTTSLNSCLAKSAQILDVESGLASTYNITSTPQFVVNCRYFTIPQTLGYAINYSLGR
jgi:hypothetical protein